MKRTSIRRSLFLTYSAIILASFFAVALVFSLLELPKREAQISASLEQTCTNLTASMDQEIDKLSTFALNIAYSTLVRDRFTGYLSGGDNTYAQQEDAKILGDLLTALIQPNRTVDQLNLYTNDGHVVASGQVNGQRHSNPETQLWYQAVSEDPHHKTLIYTGEDPLLSKFYTDTYSKHFVAYAMRLYDTFNNVQGYIEIKKNLSSVLAAAISYHSVYGEDIYVFDGAGTLIFPLNQAAPDGLYAFASQEMQSGATRSSLSRQDDFLFYAPSAESDFCTILVISQAEMLEPVYDYARSILVITFCALLLALILAYFAARRITTPISDICREVVSFDLTNPSQPPKLKTNISELHTLYDSFLDMQTKLRESMNKQLLLQNQDMQSRMLALQSQMNPHFLFNSLAAIQSMADEGMTSEIQVMCQSMSNILRYISSNSSQSVPLREELRHTTDYLICMMIRYQGDLDCDIQVPEEMQDVQVPKLCLQLLVENAIKFSSTKQPPYQVSIRGTCDPEHYELSICDNGPGFSEEAFQMLQDKIAEINRTGLLPSLEINGMGILNIYIRYRILHGEHTIFRLENRASGGACITIGEVYDGTEI